ncbi:twin transmembrane helix small protein [Methylomonas subterranea]
MKLFIQNAGFRLFYVFAMSLKTVAIVIFLAIVASLGSALYHLVKPGDEEHSRKTAQALTVRIGLSLVLFILLFVAYATGLFQPSGIGARIQQTQEIGAQPAANR